MRKITSIYKKSVEKNLKDIGIILKQLEINCSGIILDFDKTFLALSSASIIKKWLSGKKYVRTNFVKKAFCDLYPEKYTEVSILIDSIVNILDDILDEELNREQKALHIIELLRTLSLYNLKKPKKEIQIAFGHYFNKLILLASAENVYKKLIKKEKDKKIVLEHSIELLKCRSMDIDIFNEIALIDWKNKNAVRRIEEEGRIFRAVNILKKDIADIEYDKKQGIETIATYMTTKKYYNFPTYIENLLTYFFNQANKIKSTTKSYGAKTPVDNYYKMTKRDISQIKKLLNNNF